jgi:hypothetical protein
MSTPELIAACDNNPLRAAVILNAVQQVCDLGRRPTTVEVDAICAKYQNFGEALQAEVDAAMDAITAAADAKAAALEAEPTSAEPDMPVTDESSPSVVLSRDDYLERLRQLNITLESARAEVVRLTTLRNAARGRVADQLQAWVSGLPKTTHEAAARAVMETTRKVRAENRELGGRPGPSVYDRERFWGTHGDTTGTSFLKRRMVRGGKRFTRGDAMTRDGRIVKLPSDR